MISVLRKYKREQTRDSFENLLDILGLPGYDERYIKLTKQNEVLFDVTG